MKILLVADVSIYRIIGGAERVLYEESTRLARRGHSVYVLTRRLPDHESHTESIDRVEEHRYNFQEKPFPLILKSLFSDCRRRFRSLQGNSPFHIINFHQPFSATGVLSSPISRMIPKVYTCHSLSPEEYISRTSSPAHPIRRLPFRMQVLARKYIEKAILRKSDRIVVLSQHTRDKLGKVYGLPASKVSVIPGGVDLEKFKPSAHKPQIRADLNLPENRFILFTVRNLVPRMGLENLISALKIVLSESRNLFLVIGGEGPLAPSLSKAVADCNLGEFVHFVGYISDENLPSYYQMADLFVLPTKELEGFGMVTLEALASGLPVLGTPVGGTKEILACLGPEFLFADETPASMAELILKAAKTWGKDPEAYDHISKKCRSVAERYYSWDAHIDQLEGLFKRIGVQNGK